MGRTCGITAEKLIENLPIGEWVQSKSNNEIALSLVRRVKGKLRHTGHINDLLIKLEQAQPPRIELRTIPTGASNASRDSVVARHSLIIGVKRLF